MQWLTAAPPVTNTVPVDTAAAVRSDLQLKVPKPPPKKKNLLFQEGFPQSPNLKKLALNFNMINHHRLCRTIPWQSLGIFNSVNYINAFHNLTENSVTIVQLWGRHCGHKELWTGCVGSRVGHREDARLSVFWAFWRKLVFEFVARAAQ